MKIIDKPISELNPYENNPRHNESAVEAVAASIREFGFKVPIVVDGNGVIIAGHTRHKAALSLGLDTVPCIIADDLSPEQVRAFRLADNKTAELAEWDFDLMESELEALDLDMAQFGFNSADVEWDDVGDLTEDSYEEPEKTMLECPNCHHVDSATHFKKIKIKVDEIEKITVEDYNIRAATLDDIDGIKAIADNNQKTIGFVMRSTLEAAVEKDQLIIAEQDGKILAFCNYHERKDKVNVIYEICTDYKYRGNGIGKALLDFMPRPIRLKCPVDNESNNFYKNYGFELETVEEGKNRNLNVWVLKE